MTWQQWRASVWDQLAARIGYPGLAALEQYTWRSAREQRCIECGDAGAVRFERTPHSLVQSVSHYWMCADCATAWQEE